MITVKVSTMNPEWPILRQTPGHSGIWGECRFVVNEPLDSCDFWVVYDGLPKPEKTVCPRGNTLLITAEPPTVKSYSERFIQQFATIITSHRSILHPNCIFSQQALPWMVGGKFIKESKTWGKEFSKDYDELINLKEYPKDKLLSIILSRKSSTEGHARRLAFVQGLKEYFGDELDVYGVGINEIADKWDGIARYRYHLAIENSSCADYWTEKLSDAYLGNSYPLYYGCPNIADYFAEHSFTRVDIHNISSSLATIRSIIASNAYERAVPALQEAKNLILTKYNLFALLSEYCSERADIGRGEEVCLQPEDKPVSNPFTRTKRIISKILWRGRSWGS